MLRAAITAAAAADVWTAITAIQLYYSLNLPPAGAGTTTTASAQASASVADFRIFLMLVAAGGLYTAVALVYRRIHQAEAAAADAAAVGGGNRRLSDLVVFIFAAAGVLEFLLFVDGVGALGLAAFRALPAAATATFFWGMMLIIVAHIRAGGEGGGGAFAGDGQIQGPVSLLTKTAFGAAAALVCLMVMSLHAKY